MNRIVRLLEMFHVTFRFAETSKVAVSAELAQSYRHAKADDVDRMHAFEVQRIRQNPASLIGPRS